MPMTEDLFEAVYATFTEARARLRIGGERGAIIARAVCQQIQRMRIVTDNGIVNAITGTARILESDAVDGLDIGAVIEVSIASGEWVKVRVAMSHLIGGVRNMQLEAPNA
jgi:CRISPR/Cas system-associated exonuclease Cas4 (RecB family)